MIALKAALDRWHLDLQDLAPPATALFLVSSLLVRSFYSPWIGVGWTALALALVVSRRSYGPRPILYGLALLLALHALAIPGSIIWGAGNWELTLGVLLWMVPSFILYFINNQQQVFAWLMLAWLAHAGLIIWQGFTQWGMSGDGALINNGAPTGLANNPNLAAGFLALAVVYTISNRTGPLKWVSVPFLIALLFTGSRWGLLVIAGVLVLMVVLRAADWRPLAVAGAAVAGAVVALGQFTPAGYAVAGTDSFMQAVYAAKIDVGVRLAVPHIPTFLPSGIAEHPGLHNVPLRILFESGIAAAGLWVGITLWALRPTKQQGAARRHASKESQPKGVNNVHRWLLLTLVLLSLLDYYTWMGHLGGFWWLLIGASVKGVTSLPTATTSAYANASALPAYRLSGGWLPKWVTTRRFTSELVVNKGSYPRRPSISAAELLVIE